MTTLTSTTEAERLIEEAEDWIANRNRVQFADTIMHKLVALYRTSEEARVNAERERDQLRASYAEMNKLSAAAHHEWALADERAEAAEALALLPSPTAEE